MKQAATNIITIFDRDTLLHLRLPFSFYLLPVFCFGISQATNIHAINTLVLFIALHFFIYPGSNIYNSYMDKDTGSIGGLRNPPPVTYKLYQASIIVDALGILLCLLADWRIATLTLGYVAFSKSYSWQGIRFKKFAFIGWLLVMFFQGGYTYLMTSMTAENNFRLTWFSAKNMEAMLIASLLIGAYYPLTQIYQHEEDSARGDFTISYRLGITGTFLFSGFLFLSGCLVAYHYFSAYYLGSHFILFLFCLLPVMAYFIYWFVKTLQDKRHADYTHAMRITFLSSICTIICFSILFYVNHLIE